MGSQSKQKNNILILCHGNRYRSPFAMAALQYFLPDRKDKIRSAGFRPGSYTVAKPVRDLALHYFGCDLSSHRSVIVTKELVDWADLILYMDGGNLKRLRDMFIPAEKLICLGSYCRPALSRIPDPAFLSSRGRDFVYVLDRIKEACSNFAMS
jgi:low molecular weight protein-tyrosine phosphatase